MYKLIAMDFQLSKGFLKSMACALITLIALPQFSGPTF
jgi:hypothetical protein